MKSGSLTGIIAMLVLGAMSSCSFYHAKNQDEDLGFNQSELSYNLVNSRIFSRQCIACHNAASPKGGVVLETYNDVKGMLVRIEQVALINQTMPESGPLSPGSRDLLRAWIAAGAPREGTDPIPPPNLEPRFRSIRTNIFEAKCIVCHTAGGTAEKVPLIDYAALLNSPRELVLPGNPEESSLVLSVEASDDNQMPPTDSGLGRLSETEISIIKSWIQDGAKDN